MNPVLMAVWLRSVGWTLLRVLGSLLMQLITGKALKQLLLWPLEKLSRRTATTEDDKVVEKVREDWELGPAPVDTNTQKEGEKNG